MKNLFLILIAFLIVTTSFGKQVTIIKENGKLHKDGTITYKKIKQIFDSDGSLTYQHCLQRGNENCPKVGIVTIGEESIPIDEYIGLAEEVIAQNLKMGITTGRISYLSGKVMIYYKNASFVLDDDGNETEEVNYYMTIEI